MRIKSVKEYSDVIDILKDKYSISEEHRFLYRGHADHVNYKMLPGIFRTQKLEENMYIRPFNQDEKTILSEYIEKSSRGNLSYKEWLEIAQHYQVPTRQMDLTEDEYVALFFACEFKSDTYPSVWIFDESNYSKFFFQNEKAIDSSWDSTKIVEKIIKDEITERIPDSHIDANEFIMRPYTYRPEWNDRREINQKSWFMLWGASQGEFDSLVRYNSQNAISIDYSIKPKEDSILGVIEIDPMYRDHILSELSQIGYTKGFIYETDNDHGVEVKSNNFNPHNRQYEERRYGAVTITLRDVKPSKETWENKTTVQDNVKTESDDTSNAGCESEDDVDIKETIKLIKHGDKRF
ncbi:MAG: FRG domain-containing protein [Eubacterium sp.]|nr:FRG domain-containing protein [Eubacterium sp.]